MIVYVLQILRGFYQGLVANQPPLPEVNNGNQNFVPFLEQLHLSLRFYFVFRNCRDKDGIMTPAPKQRTPVRRTFVISIAALWSSVYATLLPTTGEERWVRKPKPLRGYSELREPIKTSGNCFPLVN